MTRPRVPLDERIAYRYEGPARVCWLLLPRLSARRSPLATAYQSLRRTAQIIRSGGIDAHHEDNGELPRDTVAR